jgi:hypothetical protein
MARRQIAQVDGILRDFSQTVGGEDGCDNPPRTDAVWTARGASV